MVVVSTPNKGLPGSTPNKGLPGSTPNKRLPEFGEALVFAFGRRDAGSVTDSGAAIGSIIGILATLRTHDPLIEVKAVF
jgi:hypothetical protein